MAFNIKDPEADRLLRALAASTGESMTVAARRAFEERLGREEGARTVDDEFARARVLAIVERGRRRRAKSERTTDDVIEYDDLGLPT